MEEYIDNNPTWKHQDYPEWLKAAARRYMEKRGFPCEPGKSPFSSDFYHFSFKKLLDHEGSIERDGIRHFVAKPYENQYDLAVSFAEKLEIRLISEPKQMSGCEWVFEFAPPLTLPGETPITEDILLMLGFTHQPESGRENIEYYTKNGVETWNFNGEYWIVDALDQAGIDVEFTTVGHLLEFFKACRLPNSPE